MTTQVLTVNPTRTLPHTSTIRIPFVKSTPSSAVQQETLLPLREGIYRIQTTHDDDVSGEKLYLSAQGGYVKAKPQHDSDNTSLWKVTRSRTLTSGIKYTVENVGTKEKIGVSNSRLLLITIKEADLHPYAPPFEVSFTQSGSGYQISTTLPSDYNSKDEFYLHLGIWQLEPWGKPVLPAPVHLSTKVFPEADCVWGLDFVSPLPTPTQERKESLKSVSSLESVEEDE
ncbi:hypothetical protein Moror_8226 [Moniliophthora roreri MCA 2997]|uniref:Uncharacterized protein n=2 Tax=Moniliophthora roreri TaxID=221103 RepID=V2XN91_MONRO|nr:hypothetical protein Moror_8226 [Moniliophthora roreri MCA 2997]KAI3606434.1 hypothetical protein WG66_009575 [Moniliophthora roreri]